MSLIDKYLLELGYSDNDELFGSGDKLQIKVPFVFGEKQINL
jgi:hypothetical protein